MTHDARDAHRALSILEAYYDAAPRSAATVEQVGPFTLFAGTGPWPYYARPRLGSEQQFTADDVRQVQARQRELAQPEAIEWVHETTPSLLAAVRAAGLDVLEAPLLQLNRSAWRPPEHAHGMTVRILDSEDPALAAARAVQNVAFAAAGTKPGPQGSRERNAAVDDRGLHFLRDRIERRVTVMALAETEQLGAAAAGQHQPVDSVTEIVGVATLPIVRRQGLGGAVTGALVEDALEHGSQTVFLSAGDDDIARVYTRLGFRRIGTACIVG